VFKSDDVAIIVQGLERVLQKKRLVDRDDPVVLMIAELTIEAVVRGARPGSSCQPSIWPQRVVPS
jgi:hypothetical protein